MVTASPLSDFIQPGPQFARSVNIERDALARSLDGYLPTGRALDVLRRFTATMRNPSLTRAWSITGPYGSGKSSLALLLDALTSPQDDRSRNHALQLVGSVDKPTASDLREALQAFAGDDGFIRAGVTAQREPVERTVVRALIAGLDRFPGRPRKRAALMRDAERLLQSALLPARAVADLVQDVAAVAPLLLVIDEFGKNLEFFTDRPADADLFVLQEIVERASGPEALQVFVVTLQHLAFEDYATGATITQRREWAKVQGRFEDVPFADSPSEVLQLVARVFRRTDDADPAITAAIDRWADAQYKEVERLGLTDRLPDAALLAACYPLHPLALAVLPELCSRYGQRERTLFSFLARPEPHSVVSFLEEATVSRRRLPVVGIEQVFDYFMASTGSIIATSDGASRWLEIDSRIRETQGLSDEEARVLKIAGVLNLVSRGGTLRASRHTLAYASGPDVEGVLRQLESRGLLIHRGFADEYRIWQGSDFDLHAAIDDARRRLSSESLARLCERALPLRPQVAARHSQDKGILRFFERAYVDASGLGRALSAQADGLLLYVLDGSAPESLDTVTRDGRPVLFVYPRDGAALVAAAQDAAAVAEVLASNDSLSDDWVARRELHERAALSVERFRAALDSAFALDEQGVSVRGADGTPIDTSGRRTWSALLSDICDIEYHAAPTVRNEMIARRELSSQAARARRDLLIAMVERAGEVQLGIDGYGPERAMFESVLVHSGLYREAADGWQFAEPLQDSDYRPTWLKIEDALRRSQAGPVTLDEVWRELQAPPIGLPDGPIPVLVTAALLVHADDVAVYQDGTFQAVFGAELIERLIRTPERFAVKHFATTGPRAKVLASLAARLSASAPSGRRNASLIRVLAPLVRAVRALPEYTRKTRHVDDEAKAVRDALATAVEPDALLFAKLPKAVGVRPFPPTARVTEAAAGELADRVIAALARLEAVYSSLIDSIVDAFAVGLGRPTPARLDDVRAELAVRGGGLADKVLEPRLRSFLFAASDSQLDDHDWIENLAMNVAERPPKAWRDEDRRRFESNLEEVLRAYRRVEILHLEHLDTHPAGARARQVVVTTPEGDVRESIVWLDEAAAGAIEAIVAAAMEQAATMVGARAPETLLAMLAERLMTGGVQQLEPRRSTTETRRQHG